MIAKIRAWFSAGRRRAIYAAAAAVAPLLVAAQLLTDSQSGYILTGVTILLQGFAGVLALVNLSPSQASTWFTTGGRAAIYALAAAAQPVAVGLGIVDADLASKIVTGVSLGLTALASVVGILNAQDDD